MKKPLTPTENRKRLNILRAGERKPGFKGRKR
jgi:hypothetical protein